MFPLTLTRPEWLLVLPPVLLLLFWLALPPRPRAVLWTAHLPQWLLAMAAARRRPPRLLGLPFLLLAIAAAGACLAIAGPRWGGREGPERLCVLLDASASMAARTAGGTSFGDATAILRRGLERVPPHVEVTVLRCGGELLRRHGPSARALHDLGGPAGPAHADLAELADAIGPDTVVWTLTDGQGQRRLPLAGALTVVGRKAPNGAVLAVRTVDRWPLPGFDVEVDLVAHTAAAGPATLAVAGAVAPVLPRQLELSPGVVLTVALALQRTAAGGPLELRIELPGDALPADDAGIVVLPPLPAPRIAVLAEADGGPYAGVAAAALAAEVGGEVVPGTAGTGAGLLLVDGGAAAIAPGEVRALCFGCRHEGAAEAEPWRQPSAVDWDRTGSLTAGLDLSELRVGCAFRATVPDGEPFLWAEVPGGGRVPLAVVAAGRDLASVHFGFRLQDSNLPLLPAFPQLLRRAFVRCYAAAAAAGEASPPPPAGEQDLGARASAPDRPLPAFGEPPVELGSACLLLGLLALVLRGFVR